MLLCSDCCSAQLTHCTVSMEGSKRVQIPQRWGAGIVFPRWELPGLTSSEYANNAIGYTGSKWFAGRNLCWQG